MSHTVRFFHDFSSPFSYLGSTQIEGVCNRTGATLIWHPILLGALFKSIGTPDVPLMAQPPAKRRHSLLDLYRYAEHWGVSFRFPSRFPMRTVTALRLVLAAPAESIAPLTHAIYRAFWAEDRDISDEGVLRELLSDVALDAGLLEKTADPAIKQRLFDNTQAAVDAQVFGVPSCLVDDRDLYWGQDRLDLLEWSLGRADA